MKYLVKKINDYNEVYIYYRGSDYKKAIEVYLDLTELYPNNIVQLIDVEGRIHCERKPRLEYFL